MWSSVRHAAAASTLPAAAPRLVARRTTLLRRAVGVASPHSIPSRSIVFWKRWADDAQKSTRQVISEHLSASQWQINDHKAASANPKPAPIQYALADPKHAAVLPELPHMYALSEPDAFAKAAPIDLRPLIVPTARGGGGTNQQPKKVTLLTVAFNGKANYQCMEYTAAFIREFGYNPSAQYYQSEIVEHWLLRQSIIRRRTLSNARASHSKLLNASNTEHERTEQTQVLTAARDTATETAAATAPAFAAAATAAASAASAAAAADEIGLLSAELNTVTAPKPIHVAAAAASNTRATASSTAAGAAVPSAPSLHDYLHSVQHKPAVDASDAAGAAAAAAAIAQTTATRSPSAPAPAAVQSANAKAKATPLVWPVVPASNQLMCFEPFIGHYTRAVSALNITNRIYAYVYLLDEMGRIRWRAIGPAHAQHRNELTLAQFKAERNKTYKPIKAELEVMLRHARTLIDS